MNDDQRRKEEAVHRRSQLHVNCQHARLALGSRQITHLADALMALLMAVLRTYRCSAMAVLHLPIITSLNTGTMVGSFKHIYQKDYAS